MPRRRYIEDKERISSPYSFVPLWETTVKREEKTIPSQAVLKDELISGEILYSMEAATDIFVGGGSQTEGGADEFYKNAEGKYAIPGSTLKGLIRSHAQILSLSGLGDDIDDYFLMYRNVAAGIEKGRYNEILGNKPREDQPSILKNVKAGYIEYQNGKGKIFGTQVDSIDADLGEMNYYVISERTILDEYVKAKKEKRDSSFAYLINCKGNNLLKHIPVRDEGVNFEEYTKRDGSTGYRGRENRWYLPVYEEISYSLRGDRTITAIGEPGKYENDGMVVLTGPMKEKKAVYIIPAIDTEKVVEIPQKDLRSFQIDYNNRVNSLSLNRNSDRTEERQEQYKAFFDLPKEGQRKPVFYIQLGGRLYFGFTPRLRLYYDHSVKDGLPDMHKEEGFLDYSKALFGYSDKNAARRSRVSCSDAVIIDQSIKPREAQRVILSSPKPTDCFNYLEPNEKEHTPATYNDDDLRLRGVKQYHLHSEADPGQVMEEQRRVASEITSLPAGSIFCGKVRFQNLTKEELGLLLWSLSLDENSMVNIGKAKAYGYGAVRVRVREIRSFDLQKAYSLDGLCLDPFSPIDGEQMINDYKKAINSYLKNLRLGGIDDHPSVKALLLLKDATKILPERYTKYMPLGDNDTPVSFYAQRSQNIILPEVYTLYGISVRRSRNQGKTGTVNGSTISTKSVKTYPDRKPGAVWIAKYELSDAQMKELEQYHVEVLEQAQGQAQGWVSKGDLEQFGEKYDTVLLPSRNPMGMEELAKKIFVKVFIAKKNGKTDKGWKPLKV